MDDTDTDDEDLDPTLAPPPPELATRVIARIEAEQEPLFALLDAARSPEVLSLLQAGGEEHESLYQGDEGEALAAWAPYLVRLPRRSATLEAIVRRGWGASLGLFVTSRRPFVAVRRHFRRFLIVTSEANKPLYFRFYDPRVLRVFLPTCSPRQLGLMFADVSRFLIESPDRTRLLSFELGPDGELVQRAEALEGSAAVVS